MNDWKKLWNGRSVNTEILQSGDTEKIFLELKRSNGFDVIGDGISYAAFLKQHNEIREMLSLNHEITSVYEVGCGSGANLFLYEQDGLRCGGMDYSQKLVCGARQVLLTEDILCEEALNLPVSPTYDAVFSYGVFSYFVDTAYAEAVLGRMLQKADFSIGILDLHDKKKEDAFLAYRKAMISDYEDRYKNLPKLFYEKQFFIDFAEKHDLSIKFTETHLEGYWNNEFVFSCYMYKN